MQFNVPRHSAIKEWLQGMMDYVQPTTGAIEVMYSHNEWYHRDCKLLITVPDN